MVMGMGYIRRMSFINLCFKPQVSFPAVLFDNQQFTAEQLRNAKGSFCNVFKTIYTLKSYLSKTFFSDLGVNQVCN